VLADFYGPFSTIAFTIFGLWMFVAQARFRDWMRNRDQYRRASAVSLQFALPGIMSLIALIDPESVILWRWAFGLASAVGVVLLLALARRTAGTPRGVNELTNALAGLLFVCIAVVSISPEIVDELGLRAATARGVEFFFFCLLLLNGLMTAWLMLFSETPSTGPGAGGPPPAT
jgi:hypothetical protein